ncbi:MAG: hypothetical protein HY828_01080 [Actinobacteria bacterium]|nr:hypothetical protein [Actinomycetota bacterium]
MSRPGAQAAAADDRPLRPHRVALATVVALWLAVYIPLTWPAQRNAWSSMSGQPFALYRALILFASTALWSAPALALADTARIVLRHEDEGRLRLVLAYLQTLTIILIVVVETTLASLLLADGSAADLSNHRWLALQLIVTSAAICAATTHLARIADATARLAGRRPVRDLRMARRCSLAAGIAALFAAPLSYVNRTTTPTAGAVLLYGVATGAWLIATRALSPHPRQ